MPEISVLILTWNRKDDLITALNSILMQKGVTFEIVVVDSASTDGTQEVIRERYPEVKYIELPYNMGVIGGRNIGIANCSAELVFFLDDDAMFVEENALHKVVTVFSQRQDMWALTCKVLDKDGKLWLSLVPGGSEEYINQEMLTTTFIGCASCIRSAAFRELGYFDHLYFREKEELEFSFRIYNADRYIIYYPEVTVIHLVNQEQRNPLGMIRYYHYRNEIITYFRHLPIVDAAVFWSWNTVVEGVRAFRQKSFRYYLLANLHLLYLIPVTIKTKRRKVSPQALNIIYRLKSEPVCASEWLASQYSEQDGWSLIKFIRAYASHRRLLTG